MTVNYTEFDAEKLEFVVIASEDDIQNGERIFVEIDDFDIVVFNIAGKFYAIADVCSHDDGPVGDGEFESEYEIACPRHGARFDVRNGEAVSLPAVIDIPAFPVRVIDGEVQLGIPLD
ncbi:MAG: Rieske 2Fe-2S domain-containing protein [Aliifodinibius sp.]|nr:Rieske 2Fe-2S domain-containing protein [Fodinibius sp.]